jgi:hypothetical protein
VAKRLIAEALERNPDLDGWNLAAETDTSIAQVKRYGPQGRFRPQGGNAEAGFATEKRFIEEAGRRWLDARSAEVTAFDVVCEDKRVEVKTGSKSKTSQHVTGDQWHFNLRGKDGKSDFLALYIPDTDDWFIVPTKEALAKKTRDLYVVWPRINKQGGTSFLHRYLNRWDLLQLP